MLLISLLYRFVLCVADREFKRKVSFPLRNISTYLTPYDQTIGENPNDGGNSSNSDNAGKTQGIKIKKSLALQRWY